MYTERGYDITRYINYSRILERVRKLRIEDDSCFVDEKRQMARNVAGKSREDYRAISIPRVRIILLALQRSLVGYLTRYAGTFERDVQRGELSRLCDGEQLSLNFTGFMRIGPEGLGENLDSSQIRGIFAGKSN